MLKFEMSRVTGQMVRFFRGGIAKIKNVKVLICAAKLHACKTNLKPGMDGRSLV